MPSPIYSTGQAIVTNGSADVTGSGTSWQLSLVTGGELYIDGVLGGIPIVSVTSDIALVLAYPWPGATAQADHWIVRETAESADATEANDRLAAITYRFETGTFLQPDATGTLAQRDAFDDEDQDFIYIDSSVDPFLVYIKKSSTNADWSSPGQPLRGLPGSPGLAGAPGIGDRYSVAVWDPSRAGAGEIVFELVFDTTVGFSENMAGSQAKAEIAATATAVWSLKKTPAAGGPAVEFATVTFAAVGTAGAFVSATTSFEAGDLLTVTAPTPRDATLSNVKFTLAGNR